MLLFGGAACADRVPGTEPADREFSAFLQVYPTLIRDCGFQTCHGSEERFFRVWGAGRARLDPDTRALDGSTGLEASFSIDMALSMLDERDPAQSLLLRKPLAVSAGGSSHGGVDRFGRDVYRTVNDEGYLAIARFVFAMAEEPEE
jgi:hypothetical protein